MDTTTITMTTNGVNTMTATNRIFYPGKYYIVTDDNKVVGVYDSMVQAKQFAYDTDTILIAVSSTGSHTYTPPVTKTDKIVINFDKKSLTVVGEPVTLAGIEYKGECDIDTTNWQKLITDCKAVAKTVEIVGVPPIVGKDITDEMSDL